MNKLKNFFLKKLENKFRAPRIWSNKELKKISTIFTGTVLNVSAWKDQDKEGMFYSSYFLNSSSYTISNWRESERGSSKILKDNEIVIDLEGQVEDKFLEKFETVLNHTTLEHTFDVFNSFKNLCRLSSDTVIIIVPFLQEVHFDCDFGDYWRFTPQSILKLFKKNNFELTYINFNDNKVSSIYIIAVGCKSKSKYKNQIKNIKDNKVNDVMKIKPGKFIISNNPLLNLVKKIF